MNEYPFISTLINKPWINFTISNVIINDIGIKVFNNSKYVKKEKKNLNLI